MKKLMNYGLLLAAGCFFINSANADEKQIQQALSRILPTVKPDRIAPSEIDGLYEVLVGTQILYITDDGKYIVQGSLYDVDARRDLTEEKLAAARVEAIDAIGQDQMIVFKPKKESKYTLSVFTDIDCGYCRKLHSEIDQYLDQGITIQYMFFPRAGKGSESYNKAVSVWCSEDRNASLTAAKKGDAPDEKECDNPVDEHMALGQKLGTRGTPMLVTEKGTVLPGYVPADKLAKALGAEKAGQNIQ